MYPNLIHRFTAMSDIVKIIYRPIQTECEWALSARTATLEQRVYIADVQTERAFAGMRSV